VNLYSRSSSYSLNCHVGAMLVFRMLCRITQSSDAHRTETVSDNGSVFYSVKPERSRGLC